MIRTRSLAIVATVTVLVGVPTAAGASWSPASSGFGSAVAVSMPAGEAPTATVADGDVLVSWTEAAFPNGDPVTGYIVTRYSVPTGTAETTGAGCDGSVTSLSCAERMVPSGRWKYTITPVHEGWTGSEGPASAIVTVGTTTLVFSSPTTLSSLPATLEGDLWGFEPGESVVFRLDDPTSGTELTGSITPDPVASDGAAAVSVTIPVGAELGAHTVHATGSAGSTASADVTVLDTTPPTIEDAAIVKAEGGIAGYVTQGGTYHVYADVTDPDPTSGIESVTADVSAVTAGLTAAEMTAGAYPVGGITYGYRSAPLVASTPLAEQGATFSITATDAAGNVESLEGLAVTIDNTQPSAIDVQATNVDEGTEGKAETGDRLTLTFSEPVDPGSILSGWAGAATTVTVRLGNAPGGGEQIQIWDGAGAVALPLGIVALGRNDFVNGAVMFRDSTMVMVGSEITVTLGSPNRNFKQQAAGAGTLTWTPTSTVYDRAGNLCLTAAAIETGPEDVDL